MNLKIKGLKTWATNDGGGYQFTLYRDGKKCAFVHNDGNGGCLEYLWFDSDSEDKIQSFVETLPDWESHGYKGKMSMDIFMEELINEYEMSKKIARLRKKSTLFRLLSDEKSVVRSVNTLDLEQAKRLLEKHYPNNYQFI